MEKFNFPTDSAHMRVCDLWRPFLVFCDLYNCIHILRTIACVVVFALCSVQAQDVIPVMILCRHLHDVFIPCHLTRCHSFSLRYM